MKKVYLLVMMVMCLLGLSISLAKAQLPQDHPYQKTLRNYLSTLQKKDFEVKLSPLKMEASYFNSIDEVYRAWLFFGYRQYSMIGTRGLRYDASHFTLKAIEAGGQVNMTVGKTRFMNPAGTAFWADWNYKGNSHFQSRAVKLRAFVAAAVDMMMQDQDHERGNNRRSDFLGLQLIRWAYPYGVAKDILPEKVRKAYEKGLIKMFERLEKWGPTGIHADMDMGALVGMLYTAKFVDSQNLTQRAHDHVDLILNKHLADPGYIDHGSAYDAGYNGVSLYFINWAAQLSNYKPLIQALKKMSKLKAYVTLPDPDGNRFGPFQSSPSSPNGAPHDQWSSYSRDVGITRYTDEADYLALKGGRKNILDRGTMLKEMKGELKYFNKGEAVSWGHFTVPSNEAPKKWTHEHWLDGDSFNATAFYYKNGLYEKLRSVQNSDSPLTKPPFSRKQNFTESFADKFLSLKRDTYGAIIFNDRLSSWTKKGSTKTLNGFGGGNLAAFWTPETGSVLLGGTRTAHEGGLDLKDWRIWPVHALSGEAADGHAFSSALQRHPKAKYELNQSPQKVTINGDLAGTYSDPLNSLQGKVNYERIFQIKDNGIQVTTLVNAKGSNKVKNLYEILPVYRRDAHRQQSAEPTSIEFKVNGQWQQAGADFQEVSSIRLSRFKGQVLIDFKEPQRVKLSSEEFYRVPEKKSSMQVRNIMIDLLGNDGQATKLKNASVSYFMRSSQAAPNSNWSGNNTITDTESPTITLSKTPNTPNRTQKVNISAVAKDADGIKKVQIFLADKNVKTCQNDGNCKVSVGPYDDGSYVYYATAEDKHGNIKTTSKQKVTVKTEAKNDTALPHIEVSRSPSDADDTQNVTFKVSGSDDSGIKNIEIYLDDKKEKTCSDTDQCRLVSKPLKAGKHTYKVQASDNSGNSKSTKNISFDVRKKIYPNKPPISGKVLLQKKKTFLETEVKNISDPDGDPVNLTYDWRVNKNSIALLNMPFDVNNKNKKIVKNYNSFGNNGVVDNKKEIPTWSAEGKKGGALAFDGKDDYIRVPSKKTGKTLQKFTVEAWIKPDGWGDPWASLISKPFSNKSWKDPWAVLKLSRNSNNDNLNFQITVNEDEAVSIQSKKNIPSQEWTHVAGTYDGKDLKLYINGKLDTSKRVEKKLAVGDDSTDIFIARKSMGDKKPERYKGMMDEVRLLDVALSPGEIENHYGTIYNKMSIADSQPGQNWEVAVSANDTKSYTDPIITNTITTTENSAKDGAKVSLAQNFPNPFRSSTTISYNLDTAQKTTIKIYDSSGRLVETIFEGKESAGEKSKTYKASHLASGIYFYQLITEHGTFTKKMTYIR